MGWAGDAWAGLALLWLGWCCLGWGGVAWAGVIFPGLGVSRNRQASGNAKSNRENKELFRNERLVYTKYTFPE